MRSVVIKQSEGNAFKFYKTMAVPCGLCGSETCEHCMEGPTVDYRFLGSVLGESQSVRLRNLQQDRLLCTCVSQENGNIGCQWGKWSDRWVHSTPTVYIYFLDKRYRRDTILYCHGLSLPMNKETLSKEKWRMSAIITSPQNRLLTGFRIREVRSLNRKLVVNRKDETCFYLRGNRMPYRN